MNFRIYVVSSNYISSQQGLEHYKMEDAQIKKTTYKKVMSSTIAMFKEILQNNKKRSGNCYKTTSFQYVSLIARVASINKDQSLTIEDSSSYLILNADSNYSKHISNIYTNEYYEFIVTIKICNPMIMIMVHKVTPVHCRQLQIHLMNIISDHVERQDKIRKYQQINQMRAREKAAKQQLELKEKPALVEWCQMKRKFTFSDAMEEMKLDKRLLMKLLSMLCEESKLGNLGSCYLWLGESNIAKIF